MRLVTKRKVRRWCETITQAGLTVEGLDFAQLGNGLQLTRPPVRWQGWELRINPTSSGVGAEAWLLPGGLMAGAGTVDLPSPLQTGVHYLLPAAPLAGDELVVALVVTYSPVISLHDSAPRIVGQSWGIVGATIDSVELEMEQVDNLPSDQSATISGSTGATIQTGLRVVRIGTIAVSLEGVWSASNETSSGLVRLTPAAIAVDGPQTTYSLG